MRNLVPNGLVCLRNLLHLHCGCSILMNFSCFFFCDKLFFGVVVIFFSFLTFLIVLFWVRFFGLSVFEIANFLIQSLVLSLLLKIECIKIHDLVFEFPDGIFLLVLFFLVFLYLGIDFSFLLNMWKSTSSIYRIYY